MAVTSIWPIKGRIDQVLNYAKNPEKVTEQAAKDQAGLHMIQDVMEYAANDLKTEKRSYVTCLNCREEEAAKQFMETKRHWSRISGKDKTGGRICFHGYQSFAAGEVTAKQAHQIGVELAQRLWGEQFEVLIATHCNTGHYHNHFVINSVSWRDGHKFDNLRSDYLAMRDMSDRLCLKYGLSLVEEKQDARGKNRSEYEAERNGKPTVRGLIRQDIEQAVSASVTSEEFFSRMKEKGYEFKIQSESGKLLKYPAIRPPGAKGYFRFHKLGDGFALEDILGRVANNFRRKLPFPEDEQEEVKRYRERTQPKEKPKGFHALYIRYCYELHILTRYPASVKRVSIFMREDLARMDKLDEQTRFLAENRIETKDELVSFRTKAASEVESQSKLRTDLRNELKRAQRKENLEAIADIKARISNASEAIKKKKREMFLCDCIEARSIPMEQALEELAGEQKKTERREEKDNEQLLGRSGRTGRSDVSGRR